MINLVLRYPVHTSNGQLLLATNTEVSQNSIDKLVLSNKDAVYNGSPFYSIVSVCDVYDALLSPLPYRPVSFDNRTALEDIMAMAEKNQIRWEVVRSLVAHNRKSSFLAVEPVSLDKRGSPRPEMCMVRCQRMIRTVAVNRQL